MKPAVGRESSPRVFIWEPPEPWLLTRISPDECAVQSLGGCSEGAGEVGSVRPPRWALVAAGVAVTALAVTGFVIMPHEIHAPRVPRLSEFVTTKLLERALFELTLGKVGAAATALMTVAEWISWLRS